MTTKPLLRRTQQLGVRIDAALAVEVKVLAVRQRRRFQALIEEACRDLLKKYRQKHTPR